jgi:hypothetical protein
VQAVILAEVAQVRKGLFGMGRHCSKSDGSLLELVEPNVLGLKAEPTKPPHRGTLVELWIRASAERKADPKRVPEVDLRQLSSSGANIEDVPTVQGALEVDVCTALD